MSDLYVCKEYETPYAEGYRVVRTIEEHNKIIYNQALEDFIEEYHKHLCNENCGERKCVDDMDKCVYWFYANEVAKKLTK